jgi:RNA polymerase sigma factor (TIGR02999 family)
VLVHEAYLRLVDREQPQQWNGRKHFFAAAAESMRRILVENARRKLSQKRGGGLERVELDDVETAAENAKVRQADELLALDEALTQFEQLWPEKAQLVKLRYFTGLTVPEAAKALDVSVATAERYWKFAKAWLHMQLIAD